MLVNVLIAYCIVAWAYYATRIYNELPGLMEKVGEDNPIMPGTEGIVKFVIALFMTFVVCLAPVLFVGDIHRFCTIKLRKWKSNRALRNIQRILTKHTAKGNDVSEIEKSVDKLAVTVNDHFDKML